MDVSHDALQSFAQRLMPALGCFAWKSSPYYENGTATCVSIAGRNYLISCAHVVEPFLRCHAKRKVLTGSGTQPAEPSMRLTFLDRHHDVAVLRAPDVEGLSPVEESYMMRQGIEVSDLSANSLVFLGIPWQLGDHTTSGSRFQPLVFLTEYLPSSLPRGRIAISYPTDPGVVTTLASLPHPGGISGSLLFAIPDMRLPQSEIWTLERMKAVAIITHFDSRLQQLEAISLRHLPAWLGTEDDH